MTMTHAKTRVFIGSSSEGVDVAHRLQGALSKDAGVVEVECWDQGRFELMKGILECVQNAAEWCDFAILVTTPDNATSERGQVSQTPRDNVIFEAGYFVGVLGRERTLIVQCEEDNVLLPTDLQGATIARYRRSSNDNLQAALNTVVVPIRDRILSLGPRARRTGPTVFSTSESGEFTTYMESALKKAQRVVLIGTGLNILHKDHIRKSVIDRVREDPSFQLEIVLADPLSPGVESRFVEEELSRKPRPTVGRYGLLERLRCLLEEFSISSENARVAVRLFRSYPTFALLIVDDDFFVYPYGFATLGNFSPVMHFQAGHSGEQAMIEFLREHHRKVSRGAVDAWRIQQIRQGRAKDSVGLHGFAVYYIPACGSALYEFGRKVIGYDVRAREVAQSPCSAMVGGAGKFGFHLTVCDVLYFLNEEEVRMATEELRLLLREFSPFRLTRLRIKQGVPDERSVAVVLDDPQAGLEALHFEMVHRFYRRAVASNYTVDVAESGPVDAESRRGRMLRRYLAAGILSAYRPHFSLLRQVPADAIGRVADELRKDFSGRMQEASVGVDRLAVMKRDEGGERWSIVEEIPIGRDGL